MNKKQLESMTKNELLALAAKRGIPAKSSLLKNELVKLLSGKVKTKKTTPKAGAAKASPARKKAKTGKASRPAKRSKKISRSGARGSGDSPRPSSLATGKGSVSAYPVPYPMDDMAQEAKFLIGGPKIHDEAWDETTRELPDNYGDNRLVLMVRDPHWVFSYWEIQQEKVQEGLQTLGRPAEQVRWFLRVHPAQSAGAAMRTNPVDTEIHPEARSWYLSLPQPGTSYFAEIGLMDEQGNFVPLAVSNTITLPLDRPSDVVDEQWMTTDEVFQKLYVMSGGTKPGLGSEELAKEMQLPLETPSPGVSSFSSASLVKERERKFWFWLDAELIIYGATEPGARVTLGGDRIELRSDGTFTTRFAFPDGKLPVPVSAESPDGKEVRTITPVFSRQTERPDPELKED